MISYHNHRGVATSLASNYDCERWNNIWRILAIAAILSILAVCAGPGYVFESKTSFPVTSFHSDFLSKMVVMKHFSNFVCRVFMDSCLLELTFCPCIPSNPGTPASPTSPYAKGRSQILYVQSYCNMRV